MHEVPLHRFTVGRLAAWATAQATARTVARLDLRHGVRLGRRLLRTGHRPPRGAHGVRQDRRAGAGAPLSYDVAWVGHERKLTGDSRERADRESRLRGAVESHRRPFDIEIFSERTAGFFPTMLGEKSPP
jgi:hypothetical protein